MGIRHSIFASILVASCAYGMAAGAATSMTETCYDGNMWSARMFDQAAGAVTMYGSCTEIGLPKLEIVCHSGEARVSLTAAMAFPSSQRGSIYFGELTVEGTTFDLVGQPGATNLRGGLFPTYSVPKNAPVWAQLRAGQRATLRQGDQIISFDLRGADAAIGNMFDACFG